MIRLIVFPILFIAAVGQAVSRVGGGKIQSVESGFEIQIPLEYPIIESVGSRQVVAKGPLYYLRSGGFVELNLFISEFSQYFSDLRDLSRLEFISELSKSDWEELPTPLECVVGMKQGRGSIVSYVFTWGSGRGFVVNTQNVPTSDHTLASILDSLNLQPGACAWK